jgi:RNA-binding protein
MEKLKGSQRRFLRGMANRMKPIVHIGKNGLNDAVLSAINEALDGHELIKVRFLEFKDQKKELCADIEAACFCEMVGLIGHIALFYRQQADVDKRVIKLPA